jgi:hypothetical protein
LLNDIFKSNVTDINSIVEICIDKFSKTKYYENALISNVKIDTLTELANKYKSDKGDNYQCAHNYTRFYKQVFSQILKNKNHNYTIDFAEIGLNMDNTYDIPSLLLWNEYFNKKINITGFDIDYEFDRFNGKYPNIKIIIGDQSNETDLNNLKYKKYDIIIDDGSHQSSHQQISFLNLWDSVKSGGYYIIEDLHWQPKEEKCIKTKSLFMNWKCGNWIESDYISDDFIIKIKNQIETITFIDSHSKLWGDSVKNALVCIKKIM